jgi:hypothetical protein
MALGTHYATLVATAGAAAANSYATLVEAEDYHDGMVSTHSGDWTGADELKEDALMWATRLLDQWVEWDGTKADVTFTAGIPDQPLAWPRSGVVGPEGEAWVSTIIPVWLKMATAEMARGLLASDLTKEPLRGISELQVGSIQLVFDKSNQKRVLLKSVRALIAPFGKIKEGSVSRKILRV